jgi:hypothetical protein
VIFLKSGGRTYFYFFYFDSRDFFYFLGLVLGVSPERWLGLVLGVSPERWLKGFYLRAVPALHVVIDALERARVPGMPRVTGDFWVRGMWALLAWPKTTLML